MKTFNSFDGTKLAYDDQGTGLPVLCLAGLTRNSRDFDYVLPHLGDHRVIRMDYRGRGASDWCEDFTKYAIPVEAQDAIALLDHLELDKVAILGTSRGGLIAMVLAATARDRLIGVCLNDIGPAIPADGLARIIDYVGRKPRYKSRAEMAAALPDSMKGFANVPASRWMEEARRHTKEISGGLDITYDPRLRDSMLAAADQPFVDLWPFFDALAGLPQALIRGANSDLLTLDTVKEMQRRHPDMLFTNVPDRAHVPFLDEPDALTTLHKWLESCA